MTLFTDQTGETITLSEKPSRIISIVPSQSELIWHLGLKDELIGITKFCIHPDEMFRTKTRVGGTKKLDLEKIRKLQPDLVIGNKEENERAQIEELRKEFPVWMSDIFDFKDAFRMMTGIGKMTGKEKQAQDLINQIQNELTFIDHVFEKKTVAYLIWYKPIMLAAENTFIDHVLNYCGLRNAAAHLQRYPEQNAEQLKRLNPDYVFLSSEPFPFKEKHVKEIQQLLPQSKIFLVDGEVFSWYGCRLLHLPEYIKKLKEKIDQ